ncbi:hypothetical protein F0225_05180 [Vibrio pectenicida]|uniref:EamA domain-containing protein n=1 Tax=Vibrio pectenicida TaxID=62763 RepID=A0A7Y3ZYW3_9VIBR|nr:hypothetical protein [Vibrio pectenicida]NOH70739.1 hypothetical protein [Vibrio pectenicida]
MAYFYIFLTVFFTVFGQVIIKYRVVKYAPLPESFIGKVKFLSVVLTDPLIVVGFFSAFLASIAWIIVMTKLDLSFAYPIVVGGLALLTSIVSVIILDETVDAYKLLGLTLIVSGIFVLGRTSV